MLSAIAYRPKNQLRGTTRAIAWFHQMFTTQHYEYLAQTLRSDETLNRKSPEARLVIYSLTRALSQDNPKFDCAKFLTACGIERQVSNV